uniref:TRAF family member-associated NFKB activator n=1 Tax=Nothobranchius furzeri TaxID=105023 RepID=A0A8C6VXY6_NOTFU
MERNIGDQLNKAFEAYRKVSIEKDNAKKELQKMTEYYERYTQELQKQIEDQQRLISELEAKLSAASQTSGLNKHALTLHASWDFDHISNTCILFYSLNFLHFDS